MFIRHFLKLSLGALLSYYLCLHLAHIGLLGISPTRYMPFHKIGMMVIDTFLDVGTFLLDGEYGCDGALLEDRSEASRASRGLGVEITVLC